MCYLLWCVICASAVWNIWSICLGVNILSPSPWIDLYLASDAIEEWPVNNLIAVSCDS